MKINCFLFFVSFLIAGTVTPQEIQIISQRPSIYEISYSGGILQKSGDLEKWIVVDPQPESPFRIDLSEGQMFYRVKSLEVVPIIAFTGQSNTLHTPRNRVPYSTTNLPYYFGFAQGQVDGAEGIPQEFDTLTAAIQNSKPVGSCWEFANLLDQSNYKLDQLNRFALVQTGLGGEPAWFWRSGARRHTEFINTVDQLMNTLDELPFTSSELVGVVVNQGERDSDTGGFWARDWNDFIVAVRNRYGNQVQLYIQTLNGIHLMPRQNFPTDGGWDAVYDQQMAVATGSGSSQEIENTYTFDSNALGGPENTNLFCRDNDVHYSDAGIEQLGIGTFNLFKEVNKVE